MSQGPREAPHHMKADTEYNNRLVDAPNFGARSVQNGVTSGLSQTMGNLEYKNEVKEGYHSRIPATNVNEFNFIEGSVSQRSRNPHEITG